MITDIELNGIEKKTGCLVTKNMDSIWLKDSNN